MTFHILNNKIHISKVILPAIIFSVMFSIGGNAWSYESYRTPFDYNVSRETLYKNPIPTSTIMDVCKSLIKTNSHIPSDSTKSRNQRKAGKLAALGIVFGARFALEPVKSNANVVSPQRNLVRHDNKIKKSFRSAQSIAAYRKCQKEYILSKVIYMN